MLAHAFLAVTAAAEPDATPAPAGLIELTTAKLRRLFNGRLRHTPHPPSALLAWSTWRRRHQARARACHHRTRQTQQ